MTTALKRYSVQEVAELYGVSPAVIRNHCQSGRMPAVNVSRGTKNAVWRITAEGMRAFDERAQATPEPKKSKRRRSKYQGFDFFA